jgi:hypothetical protein
VIDSGIAIARRTRQVLADPGMLRLDVRRGRFQLMTSGDAEHVRAVAEGLIQESIAPMTLAV